MVLELNGTKFVWTRRKDDAARLVAEDSISDAKIAVQIGIGRTTLENWKRDPSFRARVSEHVEAFKEAVLTQGIANRVNRVKALHDRWERMQTVITERADDPDNFHVPGGRTGLMVRQHKMVGTGRDAELVTEYAVDTGLLKELREHEKQAAQEVGQWSEKREVTGKDGVPMTFTIAISRIEDDAPSDDE